MFCSKCGKEIFDEAVICPYCGCATNIENRIIAEKVTTQNKTKKLGISFIISGAVNMVLSFIFACLPNVMARNGLAYHYDYGYSDMLDMVDIFGYIHSVIVVVCILLLIIGIILTATKKPLVNKKTQTVTTIMMTVGIAIVNVLLLMPYIVFQIEY